jgi:cytochrome oxidase Cu insertion factor (SCO1/SenC/PrrC family)
MGNKHVTPKHIMRYMLFVLFTFSATTGFANQDEQPKIKEDAPSFTLESLQGEKITLTDYRGKFVIIHFATSW